MSTNMKERRKTMKKLTKNQIHEVCNVILEAKLKLIESGYNNDYLNVGYHSGNIDILLNLIINGYNENRNFDEIIGRCLDRIGEGYKKDAQ